MKTFNVGKVYIVINAKKCVEEMKTLLKGKKYIIGTKLQKNHSV